jgi:hypothetical protein
MSNNKPHIFCETPTEKCTMNYCDENGCINRKRNLVVEPIRETSNIKERYTFIPNKKVSRTESPDSDLIINHNGRTKRKFDL